VRKVTGLKGLFVALTLGLLWSSAALAEKRHAIVIGINLYPNLPPSGQLQKAVNDSRAMGGALRQIGFSVTALENASKHELSQAFGALEQSIAPGDTVFLFFAGHGIEISGANYLLPADVPLPVTKDGRRLPARAMRDAAFNASEVLGSFHERGATVIAVLDACRDAFDEEGKRSLGLNRGGLAEMKPATGMFIMFSAGAKQLALDGLPNDTEPTSVFTRTLVPVLTRPGLSLVSLAKHVQPRVKDLAATIGHVQTPAYYDQITGDFFLVPGRGVAVEQGTAGPRDPCSGVETHWRTAESIATKAAFQAHRNQFPNCVFAGLADAKIEAIDRDERLRLERAREDRLREERAREDRLRDERAREERAREDRVREEQRQREARLHEERSRANENPSVCRRAGSLWTVNGSTVLLEGSPDSPARKFYFCETGSSDSAAGARAGSVLFSGRRSGNRYEGTAYVYAGRCGSFPYAVSGQVTNGDRGVVIAGQRPRINEANCTISGHVEGRLEFSYQRRTN
jgi:hypothetical protein